MGTRLHYAASWKASAPVCVEECVQVHAFTSRRARDAWVAEGKRGSYYHPEVGAIYPRASREALTYDRAARYMRAILQSAHGGRQSGYEALRHITPE